MNKRCTTQLSSAFNMARVFGLICVFFVSTVNGAELSTSVSVAREGGLLSTCNKTAWTEGISHSLTGDFPYENELSLSQPESGDLCGGRVSCCSADLQQRLVKKTPQAMRQRLHFLEEYHTDLVNFDKKLKEVYSEALVQSKLHTLHTLHADLKFFRHNESVDAFYKQLHLYLVESSAKGGQESLSGLHVESAVQQLFSDLFISVFHQLANPRLREFSDEYNSCIRRQTSSLQPFGEYPQRLASYFANSFQAAHLLMRSTRSLSDVLHTAAEMNVTNHSECTRALAGLFYCPTCRGIYGLSPCNSLCLNVMRGCLAPLSDLDTPWSNLVDKTLLILKKSHEANYEVEHGLLILSRRMIDAVQYAMDNGIEVVKRVRANCGDPQGPVGSSAERSSSVQRSAASIHRSSSPTGLLTGPTKTREKITDQLQMKLVELRGLFGALSERLCPDPGNSNCWTGADKGSYQKATAGRGVKAQRVNPEVSFNEHQTPNYVPLISYSLQMQQMTKELLNAGVMKIRPENANYQGIETRQQRPGIHEGSGGFEGSGDVEGSGSGQNPDDDTESDNEQSNGAVEFRTFNSSAPTPTEDEATTEHSSSAMSTHRLFQTPMLLLLPIVVVSVLQNRH